MEKSGGFKRLRNKIFLTIFLIPTIFLMMISIITGVTVHYLYANSFQVAFKSDEELIAADFNVQYSLLSAKILSVRKSADFIKAAKEANESTLVSRAQSLANSDEAILGVSVYIPSATVSSSSIGGAPNLNEVSQIPGIDDLKNKKLGDSFLSIRTQAIPVSIDSYPYVPSLGLMSIFSSIEDENGNYLGLIEELLNSQYIYSTYFDLSDHSYLSSSHVFLGYQDILLLTPYQGNYDTSRALKAEALKEIKNADGYYFLKSNFDSASMPGIFLYLETPSENLNVIYRTVNWWIVGADLLFAACAFLAAKIFADKTAKKLDDLSLKMTTDIDNLPKSQSESAK
ncbi:MAG: hypothetical protein LKJ88_03665 [Bacilli bacterium]|jgi:hypothetical protein|nr:hypothetical protein [Bacilli bacterium]